MRKKMSFIAETLGEIHPEYFVNIYIEIELKLTLAQL